MSDWTGAGTELNPQQYSLGEILDAVNKRLVARTTKNVKFEYVLEYFNELVLMLSLTIYKIQDINIVSEGESVFDIPNRVISVTKVSIDGEQYSPMSYEEYKKGESLCDNRYYIDEYTRELNFNSIIDDGTTVTLRCALEYDMADDVSPTTIIDMPRKFFYLIVFYILWQLFSHAEFLSIDDEIRYREKYILMLRKVSSIGLDQKADSTLGTPTPNISYYF